MLTTMKYRFKPTKKQAHLLESQLAECRWLYNHFLAERKTAWEEQQESLTYYEHDLKRTQRKLSAVQNGTPERGKRCKVVARVHERIANRRSNCCHQESRRLVNRFDLIAVEDLAVNQMVHNHCLAKSIQDAAWSQFTAHLAYKAAYAGRQYVAVNPAYTSQDCSQCGHRQKKTLAERVHHCTRCGLTLNRDHNAALNIKRLGQQSLGFP